MSTHSNLKGLPQAPQNAASLRMKEELDYDELMNCMRCGFCLPACPTYRETGLEAASPRGRIALMKAVVDGYMEADQQLAEQLNLCLGCRACETACPSGVNYGHLLEQARNSIETTQEHDFLPKWIRKAAFDYLFPFPKRLKKLGGWLRFYQHSGLQALTRKSGILKLFPASLKEMEQILPEARSKGVAEEMGSFIPAIGERIGTVGMFSGCIMDILFTETNQNTVRLLSEAGYDVVIPMSQNCCGALHAHSGDLKHARELAKQNIRAFRDANVDYIASNAGGCGALLVDYPHLLQDDPDEIIQEDAKWFAERVKDISQLLIDSNLSLPGFRDERVTYQGSCHLRNGMKVEAEPQKLIRQIQGVTFVELKESDRCCGSAGIYNLVQPEMSSRILDEKMEFVKETVADTLVTSNPGCLLQMKLGIEKAGLSGQMRAVHLVDLLAEAHHGSHQEH